ncbi:MAG: bifunctional methylenetetrahydrofolate dehydrogenase/methenyltetrahydrofolate cyclohydrolase FolD [Pseudomonadota bacterium]
MVNQDKIIDGKQFSELVLARLSKQVDQLKSKHDLQPGLAVVLVGDDPASTVYVRSKAKKSKECGLQSFEYRLPENATQKQVLERIEQLNQDPKVHGILVQLPLPSHLDAANVIATIDVQKDVDGFHAVNVGKLATQTGNPPIACTPLGCLWLLRDRLGSLSGKHAVIIGRSNIVGKPMAQLLLGDHCTVTIVHSRSEHLESIIRQGDIVVAAVGRARFVKGSWLKKGAIVIDVGINRIEENGKKRLVGDVDFEDAITQVDAITPVPGGVGPMTIAMLLVNTIYCACEQNSIAAPDLMIKR